MNFIKRMFIRISISGNTLKGKLVYSLIIVLFVLLLVISFFIYNVIINISKNYLSQEFKIVLKEINSNLKQLDNMKLKFYNENSIYSIVIKDEYEKNIYTYYNKKAKEKKKLLIHFKNNILTHNKYLHIYVTMYIDKDKIFKLTINNLYIIFLIIIPFLIISFLISRKIVAQRILEINEILSNYSFKKGSISLNSKIKNVRFEYIKECNVLIIEFERYKEKCFYPIGNENINCNKLLPGIKWYKDSFLFKYYFNNSIFNLVKLRINIIILKFYNIFENLNNISKEFKNQISFMLGKFKELNESLHIMKNDLTRIMKQVRNSINVSRDISLSVTEIKGVIEYLYQSLDEETRHIRIIIDNFKNVDELKNKGEDILKENQETFFKIHNSSQEGYKQLRVMTDIIKGVVNSTEDIKNIVDIITKISEDTEMLAINAAIEAAHSENDNSNFSFITDEIRLLSKNVLSSSENIINIIETLENSVNELLLISGDNVKFFRDTFDQIDNSYNNFNEMFQIYDKQFNEINSINKELNIVYELTETLSGVSFEKRNLLTKLNNLNLEFQNMVEEISESIFIYSNFFNSFIGMLNTIDISINNSYNILTSFDTILEDL